MTNTAFDAAGIEALRLILKPKRGRYDLAFTMNRWSALVRDEIRSRDEGSQDAEPTIENLDELVADLLCAPPGTVFPEVDNPAPVRKRRQRVDPERWAALLLAVIFNEYAKGKPSRITQWDHTDTFKRDKTSPFYRFATAAFKAAGLKPSESAFREASERWERSRQLSKRNIGRLLWGRLTRVPEEPPNMTWRQKPLRRRKNSPTDDLYNGINHSGIFLFSIS
jgi:hypothetical protein